MFFRLEKLCPPDGRKVRMRMEESVSSFQVFYRCCFYYYTVYDCAQLNSSLVPGGVFNCHLELVLDSSDSGTGRVVMEIQWW